MSTTSPTPSQTSRSSEWQGVVMVLIGAFCFSLAIPFIRWTHDLDPNTIAFYRALSAWLFLWVLVGVRFREPLHVETYRTSIKTLVLLGIVVSLTVSLYTYAVQNTTVAIAALLVNSAPVYVAVLSPFFLREARSPNTWLSLMLALFGAILVSNPANLKLEWSSLSGVLAAALSGLTYGVVMLIGRSMRGRTSGLTQNLWSQGITALVLLPFALQAPLDIVRANLHLLIPMGIFSLGLSYLFYFLGLQRVSAQVVSIVSLFEPVSGILMGMFFFAEIPNALGAFGGVLILFSIYLISVKSRLGPRYMLRYVTRIG